jgi:hypothetical protein
VGTEEINFLRLKLGFQPFNGCFQEAWRNGLHGFTVAQAGKDGKPAFGNSPFPISSNTDILIYNFYPVNAQFFAIV